MNVVTVVGARPQFVKAAPVSRALAHAGVEEFLLHTGQHYDRLMSDVFFEDFALKEPDANLGIGGGTHGAMTGRMLAAIEEVLLRVSPDMVIVYGDTNSTLAGAIAAAKLQVPVAHVEAGLRSRNRGMPEELNRVLTDHASELLLCPTRAAVRNLLRENVAGSVVHVGDVMYDVAVWVRSRADAGKLLAQLGLAPRSYAVATVHRAETVEHEERLSEVLCYLRALARELPVVMPLHPRTKQAIEQHGLETQPVTLVDPLGYVEMAALVASAAAVYTDSGGLQKEAYFHRVPCVTLRSETEWIETVEAGWNRLWTMSRYEVRRDIDEYGSGAASEAIVAAVVDFFEGRSRR